MCVSSRLIIAQTNPPLALPILAITQETIFHSIYRYMYGFIPNVSDFVYQK